MVSTSTSNWLDRLRSSRGFPAGDEPDLNRRLSTSTSGSLPTTESTHFLPAILQRSSSGTGEFSDVLSDLFNMGESSRTFSKSKNKISRKQKNPRFFLGTNNDNDLCSSDDLRREKSENELISSGDNSLNERKDNNLDEKEEIDLKGFSKNEVLVIDTSLLEWRFDGWVFRKNDEWKIKEKKIKSRVFCGNKKRKLVLSNLNDDKLLHKKKKMKMMKKKKKYDEILSKEQHQNNDRRAEPEPFKEVADSRGKVAQNRFPCPRPPEKLGKEGSSVILLKSIPLNDINVAAKVGKSSHKQKRPKKMKIV